MKIVITADIDMHPGTRDAALRSAVALIDGALTQPGCLEYDWAPHAYLPDRIKVFEEWSDQAALAAHFKGTHYAGMIAHLGAIGIVNAVARKFLVSKEDPVYGADGLATAEFS